MVGLLKKGDVLAERERFAAIAKFAEEQLASIEARETIPGWYHEFFEGDFGDRMFALGFEMDCGESFVRKYAFTPNDGPDRLEASLEEIDDIDVLGAGIFSLWRFYNHWSMGPVDEDDLRWLAIAFRHLKRLCGKAEIAGCFS